MKASISATWSSALVGVGPGAVAGQEEVVGVEVELGPLVRLEGVLDGELVEPELGGERLELAGGGVAHVDPDDGIRIGQAGLELRGVEVLGRQLAAT